MTARQEIENNCTLINYIDQIEAALINPIKKNDMRPYQENGIPGIDVKKYHPIS